MSQTESTTNEGTINSLVVESSKNQAKHWAFRISENKIELKQLIEILDEIAKKYAFQCEKGENTGYLHYQGYFMSQNIRGIRDSAIRKKLGSCWLKIAISPEKLIKYCTKEETRINGPWTKNIPPALDIIKNLEPWMKFIESIVTGPRDLRKIWWFWDDGNSGKSALTMYLTEKYNFCTWCRCKKSADILMCADRQYWVYILDFGKTTEFYGIWDALEQLKDGMISDAKLKREIRQIKMARPTIICFANQIPLNYSEFITKDKLDIRKVSDITEWVSNTQENSLTKVRENSLGCFLSQNNNKEMS